MSCAFSCKQETREDARGKVADNTNIPGPQDRNTINSHQPHEVRYWAQKWGVTEAKIQEAIRAVGNRVVDVKRYLGK